MNPRTILFAVVALVIAGGTAMLVQNWMKAQRDALMAQMPRAKQAPKTSEILVAKRGLPSGTIVKPGDVEWQAWPKAKINPAYIQKGKRSDKDFRGAVVRFGIAAGEPMSDGRVVKPKSRGYLAAVLPPGMRAMTIGISATTGIAGFVFPGDRVDILLSHRVTDAAEKRRVSETVLENVRILAVDQVTSEKNSKAVLRRTATLELTPKQVELMTVAQTIGQLSFSLRSLRKEDAELSVEGTASAEVDPNSPIDLPPAVRGKSFTSEGEVSRLLEGGVGDGNSVTVTVYRGQKSAVTKLRSPKR